MPRRAKHSALDGHQADGEASNLAVEKSTDSKEGKKRKRREKEKQCEAQAEAKHVHREPVTEPKEFEEAEGGRSKRRKKENKHEKEAKPTPFAAEAIKHEKSGSKKRKKRTKEKQKPKEKITAAEEEQQSTAIDPMLSDIASSTDTNAFLSAVMAAAAASTGTSMPSAAQQAMGATQQQDHTSAYLSQFANPFGIGAFPNAPFPSFQGGNFPFNLDAPFQQLTGEDIARALSGLDIPKIADAIRILGDASGSSAFHIPGQVVVPEHPVAGPSSQPVSVQSEQSHLGAQIRNLLPNFVGKGRKAFSQVPVPSAMILGQPLPAVPPPPSSGQAPPTASSTAADDDDEDHTHMLANKWLSATKLNELSKNKGTSSAVCTCRLCLKHGISQASCIRRANFLLPRKHS